MDQSPSRFLLVSLPPSATADQLNFAASLGTPAALAARITELLPGTTFDEEGKGSFRRGGYQITFEFLGAARTAIGEANGVEVTVDRADGFTALRRIVEKTGWRAVDPATLVFVDLDKSRAAGRLMPLVASAAEPASTRKSSIDWTRVALPASAVVVLSTAIWFGWQWSRRSAISARTTPTTASDLAPCPPPYRHLPVVPQKGGDSADAKRALADQFALAADETRRRMERLKDLAPEFRADEVVHQMLEYRDAAIVFPAMAGETGFMSPERLSDAAFFAQIQTTPRLPAWFAQPQRDGYLFEFHGDDCTWRAHMVELGRLCFGFAYVARPVEAANRRRTYALFSADQRVHYRMDGAVPTQNDPTVDNSTVSAAANQNPQAAAALYEAEAIRDLQHVAKVQELVKAMIGRGYIAPEQLIVSGSFAGTKIPPMLPGTFAEQVRYGYRFEFTGTTPLTPGKAVSLGIPFDSFVYSATPQTSGPTTRRAFALYPDGRIYATTEARLPTPQDQPVN